MIDDIRYLLVFARIVETGSVSGAAAALQLSAATVSAHLGKLEHSMGTALLYRNTRKLSLTPAGAKLYTSAQAMQQLYADEVLAFKHQHQSSEQHLRIGLPSVLIHHPAFHARLSDFIRQRPQAQIELFYSDERSDLLDEHLDVVLRIGALPDSGYKARHLFSLERVLVAHPSLLAQSDMPTKPLQLAAYPWIALHMLPQQRVFQHTSSQERVSVNFKAALQVDNVSAAYQLARSGLGLYTPPRFMCEPALAQGELVALLPDWQLDAMKVCALWHNNVSAHSIAHQFVHCFGDLQAA